jgi:hypothetical protein
LASDNKYMEQFRRMQRWYEQFKKIDQGTSPDRTTEEYTDIVYAFFQNCYHLKDWIRNDDTVKLPKGFDIDKDFINRNPCMLLLADICNATKHLKRDNERSKQRPEFVSKKFARTIGESEPFLKINWNINTKTGNIDAFQLATECKQKWEEFINKNIV